MRQKVAGFDLSNEEKDAMIYERAGGYTQLVQDLVSWLQRRHREHAVLEYLGRRHRAVMEERGITPKQPRQPPAIAFLDLAGYTALAEERGDEAAAALASILPASCRRPRRRQGCRPVKWLGDGVMFHFSNAGTAMRSGLELIEKTERAVSVPARMGIDAGAVIVQEGDYFGRTVQRRRPDRRLRAPARGARERRRAAERGVDGVEFELIGDVPLKGVSKAVRLHKAVRA